MITQKGENDDSAWNKLDLVFKILYHNSWGPLAASIGQRKIFFSLFRKELLYIFL